MRDLSALAAASLAVTSQQEGNLVHDNSPAMTSPGSMPATPVPAAENMPDPHVDMGPVRPVGDDGKPEPSSYSPSPRTWRQT